MAIKIRENNMLLHLFNIWSFILLCRPQDYLPILQIIKPSMTVGMLTSILYLITVKNNDNILNNWQIKLYIYFIVVIIISIPFSYYPSASLKDAINYSSIAIMFIYLFYHIINTIDKLKNIIYINCTGVAIYAIIALVFGEYKDGRLIFGDMFDPNDIAYILISFIPFNLLKISKSNKTSEIVISVINIIISLIVILKTGSRSGLLATIFIITYLMYVKTMTIKMSVAAKICIIAFVLVSMQILNISYERYKTILNVKNDYNVTDETGRVAIWKTGLWLMFSRPLTGVGMNRFSEGVGRYREARNLESAKWQAAHNSLLQIGAETGVLGLILYCYMSLNIYRTTKKIICTSHSIELVKISEMTQVGFMSQFICSMFLSQAYSLYWVLYLVISVFLSREMKISYK